jgi:hypothetical protein
MRCKTAWSLVVCGAFALIPIACGSSSSNKGTGNGGDGGLGDEGGFNFNPNGDGQIGIPDSTIPCDEECPSGLVCVQGLCEPPQPACATNADCEYDSYCNTAGQCVPYGTPPSDTTSDPDCKLSIPPGAFAPTVFCQFPAAAGVDAGGIADPYPTYVDVQATPIVVNFNQAPGTDAGTNGPPSIIAPFTVPVVGSYTENMGVIRVLSGANCGLEANLGNGAAGVTDPMRSSTAVAVGDLDGDGVAEVVAYTGTLGVVAFTRKAGVWSPLWTTIHATTDGATAFSLFAATPASYWAGPSIHDLDNDGKPEIVAEGYVINGQTGVQRAPEPADYASYYVGIPAVVADLDSNGQADLVTGSNVWDFDKDAGAWVDDPTYSLATASPAGWAGVADFNPYDGLKLPEIVVAEASTISVFNRDHSVFLGMSAIPVPGGGGGPPTIADYDGDGLPEIGLAGGDFYTVFDPDCQATPRTGGKCGTTGTNACDTSIPDGTTTTLGPPTTCPNFVLWSRKSQDHSSNITGSSVFDFEATGTAQVIYADECFARVYSGPTGQVQFSQYHSSCTWIENPTIADVDGDYHAEIVVPSNTACAPAPIGSGIDCSGSLDTADTDGGVGVDTTFPGEQCQAGADCVSGVCTAGFCRCTTSADCCAAKNSATCIEQGLECAGPPAGTAGTGNTCRAPHPHGVQGIRVYKDAQNRWVRSRTIWNQDAYAVTNVNENGTIPKTSAWASNWTTAGLNDFRQNVPGEADGKAIGDLTAQAGPNFTCTGGGAVLDAPICNRGAAPVGAGVVVGFYDGTTKICSGTTATALQIGQCEVVTCTWASPPSSTPVNVIVVANDGNGVPVCDTQNNKGLVEDVVCGVAK